jgi:hypothetical protein
VAAAAAAAAAESGLLPDGIWRERTLGTGISSGSGGRGGGELLGAGNVEWETTVRPQATNAASPREGGTSEVHRPQHNQQAAASAHPQAGSDRTPPHLREGLN